MKVLLFAILIMVNFMSLKHKLIFLLTLFLFGIIFYRIYQIRFIRHDYYLEAYQKNTIKNITYKDAPRGRILDRNGTIILDNKKINIITYRKLNKSSIQDEIKLSYKLANILSSTTEATKDELKQFYMLNNNTDYLLSTKELESYKYREITSKDIEELKFNRLNEEISKYTIKDRIAIHIYYLLNKGYSYDTKIIQENVSDNICATTLEENIEGLNCDYKYIRDLKYESLSSIIGNLGFISKENKNTYLNKGYNIKELVGISGLELEYEDTLHGTRAIYQVGEDNTTTLIQDEIPGQDLTLSIDLSIQEKLESIIKSNLEKSKAMANTKYFNSSYALISDPKTFQILALSGKKILDNNEFQDITLDIFNNGFTVGSVVKGASHTVGYINNAISIGKKMNDACVKLYNVPEKCSFKRLGYIDDISALKMSSNYYQFITAIKVANQEYHANMHLEVTKETFDKYREIFKSYGLGSTTYIDFPQEFTGIEGETIAPDLYLNLAIGQYDTYSLLGLLSYINTIANNGTRKSLSLTLKENKVVDTIPLEEKNMSRIKEGFYQVTTKGTARGYINPKYMPAGKTGTAQNYYDGKINTINQTFIGYAPKDTPKYSFVIISPNISYENEKRSYVAPVTKNITKEISDYLFTK